MIYKATELIKQEMDRQDMKYSVEEFDDRSIIFAGFGIDNGPSVRVQFVSQDNDNDVAIRLYGLVNSVAESKVENWGCRTLIARILEKQSRENAGSSKRM